jgi:RimJ/RimL family protein N-acetyltransferase
MFATSSNALGFFEKSANRVDGAKRRKTEEEAKKPEIITVEKTKDAYAKLAHVLKMKTEILEQKLTKGDVKLVPLISDSSFKNAWVKQLTNDKEYLSPYFYDGPKTIKSAEKDFRLRIAAMWGSEYPVSFAFIVVVREDFLSKEDLKKEKENRSERKKVALAKIDPKKPMNFKSVGTFTTGQLSGKEEKTEIGYITEKRFAGMGIASTALSIFLSFVQEINRIKDEYKVRVVSANARVDNVASKKVLIKNNFKAKETKEIKGKSYEIYSIDIILPNENNKGKSLKELV